jgi:hypothetical protein
MDQKWLTWAERRERAAAKRALAKGRPHRPITVRLDQAEIEALERRREKKALAECNRGVRRILACDPLYAEAKRSLKRSLRRKYRRQRQASDPGYAAVRRLRRRLAKALKGSPKAASTLTLIGCSRSELRAHLESRFAPGMSWENRHLWHIDHIRPCASFDLTDPDQQAQCFHYLNLQPLWALDNIRKGAGAC